MVNDIKLLFYYYSCILLYLQPAVEPINEVPPVAENMTPGPDIPITVPVGKS